MTTSMCATSGRRIKNMYLLLNRQEVDRPFFRQVFINAVLVVMGYGELALASLFLKKLSEYDSNDPFYLAACRRLCDLQGKREEATCKKDEALRVTDNSDASAPEQADITLGRVAQEREWSTLAGSGYTKGSGGGTAIQAPTPKERSYQPSDHSPQPIPSTPPLADPDQSFRNSLQTRQVPTTTKKQTPMKTPRQEL